MAIKLNAATGGGSVALDAPNSTDSNANVVLTLPTNDGDSGQYLQTNGSGTLSWQTVTASTGNDFQIANGDLTGVSTVTLTGIDPDAVKLVLTFENVSAGSSAELYARIGNSGGISTSGYIYNSGFYGSTSSTSFYNSFMRLNYGFNLSTNVLYGRLVLNKHSSNNWIADHTAMSTNYTDYIIGGVGYVPAGGTLDRIQIYTSNGVNFTRGTYTLSEYRE